MPRIVIWQATPIALGMLIATAADAADTALLGCWQGKEVVQYAANGASRNDPASGCQTRYFEDRITSVCSTTNGSSLIEYKYLVVRPGVYSATISSHKWRPDLVGNTREYNYRVEGRLLYITTFPQTSQPAPPTVAVRVESVSRFISASEAPHTTGRVWQNAG